MSVAGSDMVLGAISFGHALAHDWRDDEPSLREMYDAACASIVRLECEAEEREARIAVLEEEQRIMARKYACRLTDEEWVEEKRAECEADKICGHQWGNL